MIRTIENMEASNLPITGIDEDAVIVVRNTSSYGIEATIQIQTNNETVLINPMSVSVTLERNLASDVWKAYYITMYHQVLFLFDAVSCISRIFTGDDALKDKSITIIHHAKGNEFNIRYCDEEYILSSSKEKMTLKSKQPIRMLESEIFRSDDQSDGYYHYKMTREDAEILDQLSNGYSIIDMLESVMNLSETKEKFLKSYKEVNQSK